MKVISKSQMLTVQMDLSVEVVDKLKVIKDAWNYETLEDVIKEMTWSLEIPNAEDTEIVVPIGFDGPFNPATTHS